MFTFTPLLGATSPAGKTLATQSLLTFDQNVRILVDVGWDDRFSLELLSELERLTPVIDLILLTHATISHLGAYAYACKKFPGFDSIPVYATLPVINMGRVATIDAYSTAWFTSTSTKVSNSTAPAQLDDPIQISDIDGIFDRIHTLKYSQTLTLTGKLSSLRLTPHNAGHSLGGTLWRLHFGQEDIVYAVDWNHAGERHLSSSALTVPDQLSRPTTLICGARTGTAIRQRDDVLMSAIQRALDRGGSVILPTSTSARALELCHLLDYIWTDRNLNVPLLFVSRTGSRTLSYARSMLEWMSPAIVREWEDKGTSPFTFQKLKVLSSENEVLNITGPKVVLASGQGLEWGVSRELFSDLCNSYTNMVIFTEGVDDASLAGEVLALWKGKQGEPVSGPVYGHIEFEQRIEVRKSVPLHGEELETYLVEEKVRKALADRQLAADLKNRTILDQEESESESSESEEEVEEDGDFDASKVDRDILVLLQDNDIYDYDVRAAKSFKNRMFPYVPRRIRRDPYGDVIKPEEYIRAEEKDEGNAQKTDKTAGALGTKRKWTDEREEEQVTVIPSKTTIEYRNINVSCEITCIDYEGLADARSMEMIIPQIQPRKLILVSGSTEQANALAEVLRQAEVQDVYITSAGQTINSSMDANGYAVTLSYDLAHELVWQSVASGEYTVAQLRGKLRIAADGEAKAVDEAAADAMAVQAQVANEITVAPLTTRHDMVVASSQSKPLFVGDVRLAELRRRLLSEGHHAEFRGEGVLLIDGHVAVRKLENNNIVIEGGVNDVFYQVRATVYSFLARIV